jgi:hypothetical protein
MHVIMWEGHIQVLTRALDGKSSRLTLLFREAASRETVMREQLQQVLYALSLMQSL